jgi:hypothetical protein
MFPAAITSRSFVSMETTLSVVRRCVAFHPFSEGMEIVAFRREVRQVAKACCRWSSSKQKVYNLASFDADRHRQKIPEQEGPTPASVGPLFLKLWITAEAAGRHNPRRMN